MTYRNPSIFALLTIVLVIWTSLYKPSVKPATQVCTSLPIIAFELARSSDQIGALFGKTLDTLATEYIQKVDFLVLLDYFFIVTYTCFIIFFALETQKVHSSLAIKLAIIAAIIVGLFDVLENIQLQAILKTVQIDPYSAFKPDLNYLSIFTWIKWESTVLVMLLFVPFLWTQNFFSKTLSIITFGVLILGLIALTERFFTENSLKWGKIFAGGVLITFFLFIIYVLVMRVKVIINKNR